jgi:glycosyltransferase involved in cell wall biosynthesis
MSVRIAIVHDALINFGGAERTVTYMGEAFADADIITSVYLPDRTFSEFRTRRVQVLPGASFAQSESRCKQLLPLWIWGFQNLDLSRYDQVLTSTTFAAKFIKVPRGVRHVCYCYAPFRFLWKPQAYVGGGSLPYRGLLMRLCGWLAPLLRRWDFHVMQGIPEIATTCQNMAKEIDKCYKRTARVIYAPIRLSDYALATEPGAYYLTVSRLMSHKRVDLIVKVCEHLKRNLVVVGDGPELEALKRLSNGTTQFLGRVRDSTQLRELYRNSKALIFASNEDYGLVPLESQAVGRPVIAFGTGGVLETIVENQTGLFFREQTEHAIADAIQRFEKMHFDPQVIRRAVARFDVGIFKDQLRDFVLRS